MKSKKNTLLKLEEYFIVLYIREKSDFFYIYVESFCDEGKGMANVISCHLYIVFDIKNEMKA